MKFVRIIKANNLDTHNKDYIKMVKDVFFNFEKITGVPLSEIFNPFSKEDNIDEKFIAIFPKIKRYAQEEHNMYISDVDSLYFALYDVLIDNISHYK